MRLSTVIVFVHGLLFSFVIFNVYDRRTYKHLSNALFQWRPSIDKHPRYIL